MTKYKKLINLVRSWMPKRHHVEKAMLGIALILEFIKSWLPGFKDFVRAFMFIAVMIAAGFFFTLGAQLAERPVHITLEIAE